MTSIHQFDNNTRPRQWTIYSLACPVSGELRYIGVTSCSLKRRLQFHISDAKRKGKNATHKRNWINSLIVDGQIPVIAEIETGVGDGWQSAEMQWIKHFRMAGSHLTNATDGGEGTHGPKTAAHRAKIAEGNRGKKFTEARKSALRKSAKELVAKGVCHLLTEEHRKKVSIATKLRWEKYRERIA